MEKFWKDVSLATKDFLHEVVSFVVLPAVHAALVPASSKILSPLENTIPEDLKDFVDLRQVCAPNCYEQY